MLKGYINSCNKVYHKIWNKYEKVVYTIIEYINMALMLHKIVLGLLNGAQFY